ncbi:MAG: hypothetical protein DRI61_09950 [Chloroflexi bacterium]|nr:MAG: hypothetical protein DRI61_09950 [Chloroflexota bacterium]
MNPFTSLDKYEHFVYTLQQRFPSITRSTLVIIRRGRRYAELSGELIIAQEYRLVVYERLTWDAGPLLIEGYSYEVWRGNEKLYWYDSQPHPYEPSLASTHPHHKHIPPNIKHHRIPAPGLSFTKPNLPFLIREIEDMLKESQGN